MSYSLYGNEKENTMEENQPGDGMDMNRVHQAFVTLNNVLAEEGSLYGVRGVFSRDTMIRSQLFSLVGATEDDMIEVQKTYVAKTSTYRRDRDGKLQPTTPKVDLNA